LLDAAQQIGMLELVGALGAFDAALERAAAEPGTCISEQTAESLKSAYERLCLQMPNAFSAPSDSDGRRLILLESLLLQIPALQRRMLAKLYAAGLSTLSQLSQARPDELSAVAGLDPEVAASVVEHVQRFERERSKVGPNEQRNQAIERLRAITSRISQLQADFERAEAEDSSEQKRSARRGRDAALRELDLVLAEIGELSVIEELKRCPVQAKLRRVTSYLEQLQASA
jgi:Helix-hairpin-helix domain